MKIVRIEEEFWGWYSDYCLTDEFGNDIDSDEGIRIYDSKNGKII